MALTDLPIFSMISKRMAWLSQRQRVLAQNISNADTPHYKAKDLEELDFDKILRQTKFRSFAMKASNPAHLAGSTTEATRHNHCIMRDFKNLELIHNATQRYRGIRIIS